MQKERGLVEFEKKIYVIWAGWVGPRPYLKKKIKWAGSGFNPGIYMYFRDKSLV